MMDVYIIEYIEYKIYEAVLLVCFNDDQSETIMGFTYHYN